ncbi:MAG TPA: hypothetical protein P5119_04610 [Candidatus Aminicenantes bacterium]|nr:hypothetical protein [Candidatus Aminicenantes bacterium]HRY64607.1 hypothetical protein [Candidatus Aminicenantes bacterium]HRZ71520.1 hypothetical protein [Candidatus Aminicenantes bacterium]
MKINVKSIGIMMLAAAITGSAALLAGAVGGRQAVKSRAYVGHESDADMQGFIGRYPAAAGTRLDDCQTCHRGGVKGTDTEREYSPCSYCHLMVFPNPRYRTGVPKTAADTLNAYGAAYKNAGRNPGAFAAIDGQDSDGDGAANGAEVADLRNPGDPASRPGLPQAATVTLGWDEIRRLPVHSQFLLMNTTKEPTDDYVTFKGVRVLDLLSAAKVYLVGVTGITVFAPDGYSVDYTLEDIRGPFPRGRFYDGPRSLAGESAFVKYPPELPDGVRNGRKLPGPPWLLLAYERNGRPLDPSAYEKGTGRLSGEGPYRLIKPQRQPGRPDRAQKAGTYGDGWDFGAKFDHNAGACVRGACVIRVNPMPEGYEEYDWKNGWPLIGEKTVVIYGYGIR